MTLTLQGITNSIAGILTEHYPEIPVYSNQNQQGTIVPCFFVFFMHSEMKNRVGPRFIREIGIDIAYLTERNIPDAIDLMTEVADALDVMLEFIPYTDGVDTQKLRVLDREWKIDDGELHYQIQLKALVSYPADTRTIEVMEKYEGGIKDAKGSQSNKKCGRFQTAPAIQD